VTTAVTTGSYVDPGRGRITVGEWAQRWLATKVDLKPTTRRGYAGAIKTHIVPRWGTTRRTDVAHADVTAWIADLAEQGLSASTTRQVHRVLSLVAD